MSGLLFVTGNFSWLWNPVIDKGVAPKYYKSWTGLHNLTKRLSDITYEIQDKAKKMTKIVHYNRR